MIKACKNILSKIISARVKADPREEVVSISLQASHAQNSTNAKRKQDVIILLLLGGVGSYWSNLYEVSSK